MGARDVRGPSLQRAVAGGWALEWAGMLPTPPVGSLAPHGLQPAPDGAPFPRASPLLGGDWWLAPPSLVQLSAM
eukprot:9886453-Alexandrium_andersonii.AAC.1